MNGINVEWKNAFRWSRRTEILVERMIGFGATNVNVNLVEDISKVLGFQSGDLIYASFQCYFQSMRALFQWDVLACIYNVFECILMRYI